VSAYAASPFCEQGNAVACHPRRASAREGDSQSCAELMDSLPLRCASAGNDTFPVMAVPGRDPGISPGHPAFRLIALILRSRCKRRLEGGVQYSVDPPSRRSLTAAPQDEGERDDRDHGPGHSLPSWPGLSRPSRSSEVLRFTDRDHRDEPGDDGEGEMVYSHFVLDTVYHLDSARAHPARRGARSRGVADVGRGAVLQQASHAGWREALGSPGLVQV
jgi:hypothetical protein